MPERREPPPWLRARDYRERFREVRQLYEMRALEELHKLAGTQVRPVLEK